MKRTLLILLAISIYFLSGAQTEKYSRIKIKVNPSELRQIAEQGIQVDEGYYNYQENSFTAELSQREISILATMKFPTEILVDDVSQWYIDRNSAINIDEVNKKAGTSPWDYPEPADFELGSCGGFYTIDECYAELDFMAATYPDLITVRQPISDMTTFEGRSIYYVKLSDNANDSENEPQVLYTAMHHAREPIGMQHLIFYMYYLLENYEHNQEVRDLVDNTEMFFIPIFNVDGYARNIETNPNGGGMWRKNRRDNGNGTFGIDLNRNYGYAWGYDNEGSSPYTWSETYRGTDAFSEPETQMIKEFCESHDFKIALNYHSYSNLLLYAWGYIPELSADNAVFAEYAKNMTVDNHYVYGPACTTIYPSNGGSDDWMYGEQETKGKILAYTPECGSESDGFWPYILRITEICRENMIQSILAARYAGTYGKIIDQTPMIIPEKDYHFSFDLTRLGQTPANYTIHIEPLDTAFESVGDPITLSGIEVLQKVSGSIPFKLASHVKSGDTLSFVIVYNDGYVTYRDTVEKYFGTPVNLFRDDLSTSTNWTGTWGLSSNLPWSAPWCMTDTPFGNYNNNTFKSIELKTPVTLTKASVAVLEFYARWTIERGYDYVQVSISDDNGNTWKALEGRYTHPGDIYQAFLMPVYDGTSGWVREGINISEYADKPILLKFTIISNESKTYDGFYFDDVSINIIDRTVDAANENIPAYTAFLSEGYPNPSTNKVHFHYDLKNNSKGIVLVTDLSGRILKNINLEQTEGELFIQTNEFSKGVYFCTLTVEGNQPVTKKIMVGY